MWCSRGNPVLHAMCRGWCTVGAVHEMIGRGVCIPWSQPTKDVYLARADAKWTSKGGGGGGGGGWKTGGGNWRGGKGWGQQQQPAAQAEEPEPDPAVPPAKAPVAKAKAGGGGGPPGEGDGRARVEARARAEARAVLARAAARPEVLSRGTRLRRFPGAETKGGNDWPGRHFCRPGGRRQNPRQHWLQHFVFHRMGVPRRQGSSLAVLLVCSARSSSDTGGKVTGAACKPRRRSSVGSACLECSQHEQQPSPM